MAVSQEVATHTISIVRFGSEFGVVMSGEFFTNDDSVRLENRTEHGINVRFKRRHFDMSPFHPHDNPIHLDAGNIQLLKVEVDCGVFEMDISMDDEDESDGEYHPTVAFIKSANVDPIIIIR